MDSEINYAEKIKQYSLDELENIQGRLDKDKYPERYESLVREINKRQSEIKENNSGAEIADLPELYSLTTVRVFSLFFGTLAGAILLMTNIKAISKNKRPRNLILAYSILFEIAITILFYIYPSTTISALLLNLIGALTLQDYFWPKYIGKDFKYRKKSYVKPLVIWIVISIIVFLIHIILTTAVLPEHI